MKRQEDLAPAKGVVNKIKEGYNSMKKKQAVKKYENKQKKNRGSAIIETTMLIPVYIGVFYLYILLFLFHIEVGFLFQDMIEYIYPTDIKCDIEEKEDDITITQQGNIKVVRMSNSNHIFQVQLILKGNIDDPIKKIRRWQIAIDTIS